MSDFRFDVEIVDVRGDMAHTLGFERFKASIAGRPVGPVTVRVTHIYRREEDDWKIVHRHADNPIAMAEKNRHGFVTAVGDDQALDTPAGAALTIVADRGRQEKRTFR